MECASWIAVAFRLNHRLSSPQRFSRCSAIAPTRRREPETADESNSGGNPAAALHTLARTSLAPGVVGRASVWSAPAGLLALFRLNNRLSSPQRLSRCSAIVPTRRTKPETADESKSGRDPAAPLYTLARPF